MRRVRGDRGFSLLEVILAMAVLVIGALVTLTVLATSSARNEKGKSEAMAYKGCQDMMEVLMSMPYADLSNLETYRVNQGLTNLTFQITTTGFPRQASGAAYTGIYQLRDVTTDATYNFGFNAGTTNRVWEITVRVDIPPPHNIHVAIIALRKDPGFQ